MPRIRPTASFLQRLLEQLDHAGRRLLNPESQRLGDLPLDRGAGALGVELDVAAEEVVGVDPPEHQVEVGHRDRLHASLRPADADPRAGRVGAELGPVEFGSMRTKEPQPAPTESILTSGMLSRNRAMSGVGVIS